MSKVKDLKEKYGLSATLVGGSLVVGSVFGQCVLSPPEVAVEESAPPVIEEEEAPAAEPVDEPAEESEGA
tara:strand:+ start:794 stop:1003 length:210 start_codon:yes stop_codon:yes gene_type:complete